MDQILVECIVHMTIEHIGHGDAFAVPAVLAVIAQNRIMGQDNLPFVILHLLIGRDPLKMTVIEVFALQIFIMISDDQIFPAV